jgi:murein DD-endopeptidase MepM/ murein hydrolase activator NlpD
MGLHRRSVVVGRLYYYLTESPLKRLTLLLTSLLLALFIPWPAQAQGGEASYTVQVGDTLTQIALKYNLSVAQLAAFNGLANPDLILAGQKLDIPTETPMPANSDLPQTYTVQPGDTLFLIASRFGTTIAQLVMANNIADVDVINVGQTLIIPEQLAITEVVDLPAPFESITFSESTIIQGRTLVVSVALAEEASLSVTFDERPVFMTGDGRTYWGIVGIHALQPVGVYPLTFQAVLDDGREVSATQNVVVVAGPYATEDIQLIPGRESLLDPQVVQAEAAKLNALWSQVTPYPRWAGAFRFPIDNVRLTSGFGTRRSYDGGPVNGFHGGTDFGVGTGVPIYAPAAGVVVMAENLAVRGGAVLIDHGLGLFSGYWHQSQIVVEVGQEVAPGDLIGYVGDTGLVTGAHLHWEMRLGGIAVEPLQWVEETIP